MQSFSLDKCLAAIHTAIHDAAEGVESELRDLRNEAKSLKVMLAKSEDGLRAAEKEIERLGIILKRRGLDPTKDAPLDQLERIGIYP